jgi:hypothetical protein
MFEMDRPVLVYDESGNKFHAVGYENNEGIKELKIKTLAESAGGSYNFTMVPASVYTMEPPKTLYEQFKQLRSDFPQLPNFGDNFIANVGLIREWYVKFDNFIEKNRDKLS